jgi:hypothetical protein
LPVTSTIAATASRCVTMPSRAKRFPCLKTSLTGTSHFATILEIRRSVRAHESSRNFLDCSSGVYWIPPDWPGPANFQQPLNYGRIPWSASRISPCHHVHSPGGAPTKTCFDCTFHRTNLAELGHSPRRPRLRSEAKALIQTGRLEAGDLGTLTAPIVSVIAW